jgi:hypothetical protein
MELLEAIHLVCADTREEDVDAGTDLDIVDSIRVYDNDEIDSWVECETIAGGGDLETAYRMVIDASDDEIEDAFGHSDPAATCPLSGTGECPADQTGCTAC